MLLFLILLIPGLIFLAIGLNQRIKSYWNCWEGWILTGVLILIFALGLGAIGLYANTYKDLHYQQILYEHDSLVYQLDNQFYNKITYDGRKELMNDILSYNQRVMGGRAKHNSLWIGILYPEDWDSLPLISLEDK